MLLKQVLQAVLIAEAKFAFRSKKMFLYFIIIIFLQ